MENPGVSLPELLVAADEHPRALHPLTSYFEIYSTYQLHKLHQSLTLTYPLLWQLIPVKSPRLTD